MHDISTISGPAFLAFMGASVLLAVTPGPAVLYIVTRSATQGRAAGMASVAGIALGNLGNALAASLGLAALFAVSASAFLVVKYLGAAYLVYLGVQALRAPARNATQEGAAPLAPRPLRRIFADGFVVALLNPKTTLFFAAFLPQFLPAGAGAAQTILLGVVFVLIAATTDTCYALASGTLGPRLAQGGAVRAAGRYVSGTVFIGMGVFAARQ